MTLHFEAGLAALTMHDNGRGFDPTLVSPGHYSLNIMHEHAVAIGAQLSVISQVGHGTEIKRCWINAPQ